MPNNPLRHCPAVITTLLDRIPDQPTREWYTAQDAQHCWSRKVMTNGIISQRHTRVGSAPNNFPTTTLHDSDQVRELVQVPYNLDFLTLEFGDTERRREDALVSLLIWFRLDACAPNRWEPGEAATVVVPVRVSARERSTGPGTLSPADHTAGPVSGVAATAATPGVLHSPTGHHSVSARPKPVPDGIQRQIEARPRIRHRP